MSAVTDTREALELRAATPEQKTVHDLLARMAPEIEKALPIAVTPERFGRVILTELRRTPALYDCTPESLIAAMMLSAQLGLEPGPLGHVYLVPFKREVTWILGYKGMIALARRSGELRDIVARTVYEGDTFDYAYGLRDKLTHKPCEPSERGVARCWYGVARLTHAGYVLHVAYPEEIEAARKRSAAGRDGKGPWASDYEAMARKTVIRRMSPYLPLSPTFGRALEADEGRVALGDDGEPVPEDDDGEEDEWDA